MKRERGFNILTRRDKCFLNHKNIVQAVDVMFDGVEYLQSHSHDPPIRHTMAIQKVKDNKDNRSTKTNCGLHMWDDTTMIVAYGKECILSVLKAEKNDETSNSLSLK